MPGYEHKRFFASTAVLLNELLKGVICLFLFLRDQKHALGSDFSITAAFKSLITPDAWKLAIPASLYTLQNNLQYVAVSNLDAATFQVTYQLKIITTAFFTVTILRRQLSSLKWTALFMLTGGIALVQLPSTTSIAHDDMNQMTGLLAVIFACTLSGLAGVYFEKVLKGSKHSLWTLNLQLSFFSLFPALFIGVLLKDGQGIREHGFWYGYNIVVWAAIVAQAAGGLLVAMCVAYADNIMKNFATSISILISAIASVWFFEFVVTVNFVVGAGIVLAATYLYGLPDAKPPTKEEQELTENLIRQDNKDGHEVEDEDKR